MLRVFFAAHDWEFVQDPKGTERKVRSFTVSCANCSEHPRCHFERSFTTAAGVTREGSVALDVG